VKPLGVIMPENDFDLRFDLANNVIAELHNLVLIHNLSYLDAILHYSEVSGLEIEVLAEIMSKDPLIKSKLQIEAENLNFLKKTDRLPV
jgi:hypothetical protein